jgi:RNA recognition motif-containing protein
VLKGGVTHQVSLRQHLLAKSRRNRKRLIHPTFSILAMSSGGQPQGGRKANSRLPPEVNRVLYVRNLPFKITAEEMYDIFGKYGAIRQIRL